MSRWTFRRRRSARVAIVDEDRERDLVTDMAHAGAPYCGANGPAGTVCMLEPGHADGLVDAIHLGRTAFDRPRVWAAWIV